MVEIALSRIHFPVRTLGPGNRVGVWFQGCSIRCPGCISRDTWEPGADRISVDALTEQLAAWAPYANGLTISGGEPLDQLEALEGLLSLWSHISGTDVLLFTGHPWAAVSAWVGSKAGLIDCVVAGPYDRGAGDTLALRGSDNQTLHILTDRAAKFRDFDRTATADDRRLDVMFDEAGAAWFAGIPAKGAFRKLRRMLADQGDVLVTSDQRARPAQ